MSEAEKRNYTNIYFSYIEGIVRGYRNSLLTGQNYNNMTQCETIDGTLPNFS